MNKLFLKKQYFRMKMKEGTSVKKHLEHMKELMDRLAVIGTPTAEGDRPLSANKAWLVNSACASGRNS